MIHIYTGDGKGKTTAALGLALRSLGAQKKVAIIQFLKKPETSEYKAIKKYQLPIYIESFGIGFYRILGDKKPKIKHLAACQLALQKSREILLSHTYNLIILDEINVALRYNLLKIEEVIEILKSVNKKTDLVLTGRNAPRRLIEMADLVTIMKKEKTLF